MMYETRKNGEEVRKEGKEEAFAVSNILLAEFS